MQWAQWIALGVAPCLFWLAWLWFKDRHEREPRLLLLRAFALGAVTPAVILAVRPWLEEALLPAELGTAHLLLDAFVVTALAEELVKLAAMLLAIGRHAELDEPLDGIVYGGAAALGFASIESVLFVAAHQSPSLAFERGFTTALVHLACTGALGWSFARARVTRRWAVAPLLGMLAACVALHGVYDAFLLAGRGKTALLVVLPVTLALFAALLRVALRDSAARAAARWAPARSDPAVGPGAQGLAASVSVDARVVDELVACGVRAERHRALTRLQNRTPHQARRLAYGEGEGAPPVT